MEIKINPSSETDLYFIEVCKITISISQCSGFFLKRRLYVCVARSVSIRTNFKPDLIFFLVLITLLSRLSQWITYNFKPTITLFCALNNRSKKVVTVFGHKCTFGQNIFNMNPVQGFVRVAIVRYVFQI